MPLIEASINSILKQWRVLWPGGLKDEQYSTLNLLAQCRDGGLGYNKAVCRDCDHLEWYASSCGDRHCPKCLGPRQMKWSDQVCRRLPDCPHFHVVYTMPEEMHDFFEANYRVAAGLLFAAAATTMKKFQKNNWKLQSGFVGVLHTWGQRLNWHPHLHVLVSSGGADLKTGNWREARKNYLFPVTLMSKVMRGEFLSRLEALEGEEGIKWPPGLETVEERRDWRLRLARANWNIFCRPTLGNTRAVVRYLARYTSRIAMSNQRIIGVDEEERTVTFGWKNYRKEGRKSEITMKGKTFIRQFTKHLVPKGFRRVRYFGLLARPTGTAYEIPGGPGKCIGEKEAESRVPACRKCKGENWRYEACYSEVDTSVVDCLFDISSCVISLSALREKSFTLGARAGPRDKGVQQAEGAG